MHSLHSLGKLCLGLRADRNKNLNFNHNITRPNITPNITQNNKFSKMRCPERLHKKMKQ